MLKFLPLLALSLVTCMADDVKKSPVKIPASKFGERGHTLDKVDAVKQRVKDKHALLLDVREQDEWNDGHLKRAKLLPLSIIRMGKFTKEQQKLLPKGKPIYVHCGSGGRVLTVSKLLRAKGYDIRPLSLGYSSLLKRGFEKATPKKQSVTNGK